VILYQPKSQGYQLIDLIQNSIAEIYDVELSFAQSSTILDTGGGKVCLQKGDTAASPKGLDGIYRNQSRCSITEATEW